MTDLPKGWAIAPIEKLIAYDGVFNDGDWVESKDQDPKGGVRLIQLADIADSRFVNKSSRFLTHKKALELNCTFLRKGDLLIARMPDPLGRCCRFPLDGEERFVTVVDVCVIRLGSAEIDPGYLMRAINSPSIRSEISGLQSGSTRKRISRGNLATVLIPTPPLNEQRRIVEKIEVMFERIDKGVENLRGAKASLALYRQSLLKSAFEGKLTADWRAQNADKLEPPKTLLARIQKERETRYKSALDDWQTALAEWRAGGEVGRKPGKPIRLPEIDVNAEVSLQHVVLDVSQGWSPKCKNSASQSDSTWAVIKTTAIQPTRFNDAENKELPEDLTPREDLELSCGDVLITRAGPRKRVGVACMVKQTRPRLMLCDKAYRLTLDASFVMPEFVELFLNAPDTQDKLEDLKSGISDSGLNLTQDKFLALPFWLPPKPEQAEITRILDTRLTAADRMEAEIDAALSRADALRQSILKRAFAGTLVPQDPTDEPAPTLLAGIKAERAKAGRAKPARKVSA